MSAQPPPPPPPPPPPQALLPGAARGRSTYPRRTSQAADGTWSCCMMTWPAWAGRSGTSMVHGRSGVEATHDVSWKAGARALSLCAGGRLQVPACQCRRRFARTEPRPSGKQRGRTHPAAPPSAAAAAPPPPAPRGAPQTAAPAPAATRTTAAPPARAGGTRQRQSGGAEPGGRPAGIPRPATDARCHCRCQPCVPAPAAPRAAGAPGRG